MIALVLRALLLQVVTLVPVRAEDDLRLEELKKRRRFWESSLFKTAKRLNWRLSPAIWATGVGACLYNWDQGGAETARDMEPGGDLDLPYDCADDAGVVDDLRRSTVALACLDFDSASEDETRRIVPSLIALSRYALEKGSDDVAFDLLHNSLPLIADDDPLLLSVTGPGLKLALAGGKSAQITIMSTKAAVAAISAAGEDAQLRLAAYAACEVAIERIAMLEDYLRAPVAEMLMPALKKRDWLDHLRVRLIPSITNAEGIEQYRRILYSPDWPRRVSDLESEQAIHLMPALLHLMRAEIDFENERLRLARVIEGKQITTNEIDWTFSMIAYQRAIPHSGSLLKDPAFAKQLVLLTHEISHIFSFLGGIGGALTALRVAGFEVASELWRFPEGSSKEAISSAFESMRGLADLKPGEAILLLSAERQLEIRRKSQVLLDVWTPWLEGIAVFGELGADPALDPLGINPVTECLRNLVDIFYDEKKETSASEQILAHYAEFERRCSEAIQSIGPQRLEDYIRYDNEPYFHGYLVVRAIASRWRLTTGRNLSSAECFDLMLHATRYGVHEFIPDLSLGGTEFEIAAREGMQRFVMSLASLPDEDIALYQARTDSSAPGRPVKWKMGRLEGLKGDEISETHKEQERYIALRIEQALRTLTNSNDIQRLQPQSDEELAFLTMVTRAGQEKITERWSDNERRSRFIKLFYAFFDLGSVLPIGSCSSVFYLQNYNDVPYSRIFLNIRTIEDRPDGSGASYNGIWFPISSDAGRNLSEEYQRRCVPRLDISRVIILSGLDLEEGRLRFPHFFALQYSEWFHVIGASAWVQAIERFAPEIWTGCTDLIRRRLQEDSVNLIEKRYIASGNEAVERTLAWLTASEEWSVHGETFDVSGWVGHVKALAQCLLNSSERRRVSRNTSQAALVSAVYGDTEWSRKLNESSFSEITKRTPALRLDFVSALYETARGAAQSAFLDLNAARMSIDGVSLFTNGAAGWDIAPAKIGENQQ